MALLDDFRNAASAPPAQGRALPFGAYRDPDVFEMEMERIFRRDWVALCPAAELPNPGDYLALDLAGEPIVVIRGDDAELRALSNVCRHRGTVLLDEGYGNASKFLCPYHAWNYDLTGKLTGVPYPGNVKIDKEAHCLPRFGLTVFAGAIFVNLDPDAEPLERRLTGIDRWLKNFQTERYAFSGGRQKLYRWDANWKLAFQNGIESYHLFRVHPKTFEVGAPTRDAFYVEGSARWTITAGKLHPAPREKRPEDPPTIGDFERANYVLVSIPPSLVGIITPDSWGWLSVLPAAPGKCTLGGGSLTPWKREPQRTSGSGQSFFDRVMEEDRWICERGHRGMSARLSHGGQLVELERVVANFHQYLAWRLFDHEPEKPWTAPAVAGF